MSRLFLATSDHLNSKTYLVESEMDSYDGSQAGSAPGADNTKERHPDLGRSATKERQGGFMVQSQENHGHNT